MKLNSNQVLRNLKTKTILEYDYDGQDIPDYSTAFTTAINKAVEIYNGKELK